MIIWLMIGRLRRADYAQIQRVVVRKREQNTLLVATLAAIGMLEAEEGAGDR